MTFYQINTLRFETCHNVVLIGGLRFYSQEEYCGLLNNHMTKYFPKLIREIA